MTKEAKDSATFLDHLWTKVGCQDVLKAYFMQADGNPACTATHLKKALLGMKNPSKYFLLRHP